MNKVIFSSIGVILFLTGCVTTQKPSELSQLQIRVGQLENQVQQKDEGINELHYQVDNLTSHNEDSNYQYNEPVEENSAKTADTPAMGLDKEIIRVPVSARQVQTALKNAGYYDGNVDGKVGPRTKKAIADFQKAKNLKADGIIGKGTWAQLETYLEAKK